MITNVSVKATLAWMCTILLTVLLDAHAVHDSILLLSIKLAACTMQNKVIS